MRASAPARSRTQPPPCVSSAPSLHPPAERGLAAAAVFESEALPHLRALYRRALHLTRNRASAEDMTQETCLRALRCMGSYAPGSNMRAWLFAILRSVDLDGRRSTRRRPSTTPLDETLGRVLAEAATQERICSSREIAGVVQGLPAAQRAVILLREVEGFSYAQIAELERIPEGTVMSRLFRARHTLRESLGPFQADRSGNDVPVRGADGRPGPACETPPERTA